MQIDNIRKLGVKLFGKSFVNSNEFTTFVQGNPHLLRFKIEEEVTAVNEAISSLGSRIFRTDEEKAYEQHFSVLESLRVRRDLLKELDRFIMEYIENTN
jgi:hypothetical protein